MAEFLLRRCATAVAMILVVSFVIFALARSIPVSPALMVLGADAPDELIEAFEVSHGLDRPVVVQYYHWIAKVVTQFDFGVSYVSARPITQEIRETLPVTLELLAVAMLMCLCVAIPFGVISALNREGLIDHLLRMLAIVGISTPGFWIGLLLILAVGPPRPVPSRRPGAAVQRAPAAPQVDLPAGREPGHLLHRHHQPHDARLRPRSAQPGLCAHGVALGLPKSRIKLSYILRNALIPIVSVVAMACRYMFGWAIVIEQVFNLPGICRALLAAVFSRDYNLVQGTVLVISAAFVTLNLLADISYRFLNPKIPW